MRTYCHDCGAKTIAVKTGKFDTKTGKPEMKQECTAKDDCLHAGHDFIPTPSVRMDFWNFLDRFYPVECTKCGKTATGDSAMSD